MNQVGDLLFSLPALCNLRQRFPNAHIASVVRPSFRELLELSDVIDEIIERPRGSFRSDLRVASVLRQEKFDLAVVFSTSMGMSRLALLSGCRRRIGFDKKPTGFLHTKRVPWAAPPSTKNNLRLVEAIGCPVVKRDYVGLIKPREADEAEAARLLTSAGVDDGPFVVLGPGTSTGREIKRWSNEGFAEVADRLAGEFKIKSVLVGLAGGNEVSRMSRNAIDLTGDTSLPVLAAILKRARLFIGVDSGIMHLAAAMGARVVGLFGPSGPCITGPQGDGHAVVTSGIDCAPCLKSNCRDPVCMRMITVEEVARSAAALLA